MESTNEKPAEQLGDYIKRLRKERGLTIVAFAERTKLSKQYICDLEHNRRGRKLDGLTAAKIAAVLDVPTSDVVDKVRKVTSKEARNYADYHRILRSRVRATAALTDISELRNGLAMLRIALKTYQHTPKEAYKLLQKLENITESLDSTLSYKREPAKRWTRVQGDDAKFGPGRPLQNAR